MRFALGAMHGETVIDHTEASQLDQVNRLDLNAEAKTFCVTAKNIMNADLAHTDRVLDQRDALLNKISSPHVGVKIIKFEQ